MPRHKRRLECKRTAGHIAQSLEQLLIETHEHIYSQINLTLEERQEEKVNTEQEAIALRQNYLLLIL